MLAMPTHRDIPPVTVTSLLATCDLLTAKGIPYKCEIQVGSSIVTFSRSKAAHSFLQSDYTHLFWVDSDIVWAADDFLKVLALTTKLDVVGAAYPAKQDPTVFFINFDDPNFVFNEFGCFDLKGMGLGFTCVSRHIIEKLAAKAPLEKLPDTPEPIPSIFRIDCKDGNARGEDMAFFADIRDLGHQTFCCPTVRLGHVGSKIYAASLIEYLKEK